MCFLREIRAQEIEIREKAQRLSGGIKNKPAHFDKMTSPLRFEGSMSLGEGDRLSPIKLPDTEVRPMKAPAVDILAKHPHGLRAKHDARRNTIHHAGGSKTVETPLTQKISDLEKGTDRRFPLTSPRMHYEPNLESLRKAKAMFKNRLLEFKSPSTYSSPSNKENIGALKQKGKRTSASDASSVASSSFSQKSLFESSPIKAGSPVQNPELSASEVAQASQFSVLTLKRAADVDIEKLPFKISKIITNANDSEGDGPEKSRLVTDDEQDQEQSQEEDDQQQDANDLIQVDDVFSKEDIVTRFSNSHSPRKLENIGTVVDEDESEVISANQKQNNVNAMKPSEPEVTQVSKIIRSINEEDYVTPERYTEPRAKSPATSQNNRVAEMNSATHDPKISTSPLKNHQVSSLSKSVSAYEVGFDNDDNQDSDLDQEELSDTLMSPNSRPVFSLNHVRKIEMEQNKEVEALEEIVNQKNREILKFSEELSSTNSKFLLFDQKIKELKLSRRKLLANEEISNIQLAHSERELTRLAKKLKHEDRSVKKLHEESEKLKVDLKITREKCNELEKEKATLEDIITGLENELSKYKESYQEAISNVSNLESDLKDKDTEISYLRRSNIENSERIESLSKDKEDLFKNNEKLRDENRGLEDLNSKQQELLDELDNLETLAKDKIGKLESALDNKTQEHISAELQLKKVNESLESTTEENKHLTRRLEETQSYLKSLKEEFGEQAELRANLEAKVKILEDELNDSHKQSEETQKTIEKLKSAAEESDSRHSTLLSEIEQLKSANNEKDEIITGDTKKLNELMSKVNQQKKAIAEYEKSYSLSLERLEKSESKKDDSHLHKEIEALKKQISEGQDKTNARIQEVAEQLYHEYSKKHELKVNQIRASFKKQLDSINIEKKSHVRENESLQKKLETVTMEKDQLLRLLDEYKSISNVGDRKALSPKKTAVPKSYKH